MKIDFLFPAFFLFLLNFLFSIEAFSIAQNSLTELVQSYQTTKQDMEKQENKKREILGSIYQINQRIKKINKEKGFLTQEMLGTQNNIKSLARVIADLDLVIQNQKKQVSQSLRNLYKMGNMAYFKIIFSSQSSNDLDRNLKYMQMISQKDYSLLESYRLNVKRLINEKNSLHKEVKRLLVLKKEIQKNEQLISSDHKAKLKIVKKIDNNLINQIQQLSEVRAKTHSVVISDLKNNEDLLEILKPSFYEQKGKLIAPIDGELHQGFGLINEPSWRWVHKGHHYKVTDSKSIRSIFQGIISFVGTLRGYGKTVIIDHGDHYYSVYSALGNTKVSVGQKVVMGSIIGSSGYFEFHPGPGLYFEIRHFSEPENPKEWLHGDTLQVSSITDEYSTAK